MSGIFWLASYPKSGNTWLRVFITNLRRDAKAPASINELESGPIASEPTLFDDAVGYDASDLTHEEIETLRPEVYRHQASRSAEPLFMKVHDAYTTLPSGAPLFPAEITAGVIYLIRNPLDVCVSFTHHQRHNDYDHTISLMERSTAAMNGARRRQQPQLRQRLLTWSEHVASWTTAASLRVHVMRYEDMLSSPIETFAAAASFAGLPCDEDRVARAVEHSSMEELQRQEMEQGFVEGVSPTRKFFRSGRAGSWRNELSAEQARRIIDRHGCLMRQYGYVEEMQSSVSFLSPNASGV